MAEAQKHTIPFKLEGLIVVAGHYGVGKTNLSLNLALDAAQAGKSTHVIDIDVVNPYFRSSDYRQVLEDEGIDVVAPVFAGSALDSPSLSGRIETVINDYGAAQGECVIVDAGGDDVGATALGRFAPAIKHAPYQMFYVVNAYRNLTQEPEEAVQLLYEIEYKSHLKATGIVNNSHLQNETTFKTIEDSLPFARKIADSLHIPLACTTAPITLLEKNTLPNSIENVYPVQRYVRTSWDT